MKARALHVAEQPFETEPAEIAGTARGVERESTVRIALAADQRAVDEDRVGGLRSGLRGLGEGDHAVERDARGGKLGVERAQRIDQRRSRRLASASTARLRAASAMPA
jgi:hypothetical protein